MTGQTVRLVAASAETWLAANQAYLSAAIRAVKDNLNGSPVDDTPAWTFDAPPALETLCQRFQLTRFERAVLVLCAAVELDASVAALCAEAQGDAARRYATFGIALAALPEAHWSALTPHAPLRHWRLLDVQGAPLTQAMLRIDERILHYLTGISGIDERLAALITPLRDHALTVASQRDAVRQITQAWHTSITTPPVIVLHGPDVMSKRHVARLACQSVGLDVWRLPAAALPPRSEEQDTLARLWSREAVLIPAALYLDAEESETAQRDVAQHFAARVQGALFFASREPATGLLETTVRIAIHKPHVEEQRAAWERGLTHLGPQAHDIATRLAAHFDFTATTIQSVVTDAPAHGGGAAERVWEAARVHARGGLEDLGQRIVSHASWDDLVLPAPELALLQDILRHVRYRHTVYETWGFAAKGRRGLGISALFAGGSGTGKTFAAEVLANALNLDLYRIDLASLMSKYIGETSKNLRRIFDAAEASGAVLFFDEADAVFGKRSEVKDSHDRYANIEINYLLQRMETYRGLAILATNLKDALDTAFTRRLRFIIDFPFPGLAERETLWHRVFPAATPTQDLDYAALARLHVTGAQIRNIALSAAFLAAEQCQPVTMTHLLAAARGEYVKVERPLTPGEVMGWV